MRMMRAFKPSVDGDSSSQDIFVALNFKSSLEN